MLIKLRLFVNSFVKLHFVELFFLEIIEVSFSEHSLYVGQYRSFTVLIYIPRKIVDR